MTDRQEYRRLYYILKKREQRFSASKEWSDYDKVLKSGLFDLEAPKDISDEDLPFYREIAENLYKNKFASVAGLREVRRKSVATLKKHGYNIPVSKYNKFADFMAAEKNTKLIDIYSSEELARAFINGDAKHKTVQNIINEIG
jgi:Cys-tRNA synthase (O-phospho-L-seryl-tRNA:Cys-tRNA synthase)